MTGADRRELERICSVIKDHHAGLKQYSARNLISLLTTDTKSVNKTMSDAEHENRFRGKSSMQRTQLVLDIALLNIAAVLVLATPQAAETEGTAYNWNWGTEIDSNTLPNPQFVFELMLTNIINLCLCIRNLTLSGFDAPARILHRSFVEQSDVFIVIAADESLYREFVQDIGDSFEDATNHWRMHFTPGKIRRELERIHVEIGLDERTMEVIEIKKSRYEHLSFFAHNNYAAHFVSGMPREGDICRTSLGGRLSDLSVFTLQNFTYDAFMFGSVLSKVVEKYHGWAPSPSSNLFDRYCLHVRLLSALYVLWYGDLFSNSLET
jgi:hypothetical protein